MYKLLSLLAAALILTVSASQAAVDSAQHPASTSKKITLKLEPASPIIPDLFPDRDPNRPRSSQSFTHPAPARDPLARLPLQLHTPSDLDRLLANLDVDAIERPWATTTTIRLRTLTPALGKIVPFATVSHQVDVDETAQRLGIGAGLQYTLYKNISLASELIYYASDNDTYSPHFNHETLFMAHLQIDF